MSPIKVNCMMQTFGFAVRAICKAIVLHATITANQKDQEVKLSNELYVHLHFMDDAINHGMGS